MADEDKISPEVSEVSIRGPLSDSTPVRRSGYLCLRLEQVKRLIIQHRNIRLVKQTICEQWNISKRRAEQYVRMVYEIWAQHYEHDIIEHGVRAVADREEIIRLAIKKGNTPALQVALRAMDTRDRILGVLREHLDVSGKLGVTHKADLAALVEAARNNGSGIANGAEQRGAYLGRGSAAAN